MQSNSRDPTSNSNPNPHPNGAPAMFPNPIRGSHHRRARSELPFRIPDEFADPLAASNNFDEIGSEDDLFCTFMDIEKIGCRLEGSGSGSESGGAQDPMAEMMMMKPKHRYSNSIDGSSMMNSSAMGGGGGGGEGGSFGEVMEAKKAMTAEQLAELAAVDPKKAKRSNFLGFCWILCLV